MSAATTHPRSLARARRILDGDVAAFEALFESLNAALVRLARFYVRTPAIAEEVAQDTWIAVLEGLSSFEGRASLETWIKRIGMNQARKRIVRERRIVPLSSLGDASEIAIGSSPDAIEGPAPWTTAPRAWQEVGPEAAALRAEMIDRVRSEVEALPTRQRAVVSLRDLGGRSPDEVRRALGLSDVNQRVLLHRGRARVRRALADAPRDSEARTTEDRGARSLLRAF